MPAAENRLQQGAGDAGAGIGLREVDRVFTGIADGGKDGRQVGFRRGAVVREGPGGEVQRFVGQGLGRGGRGRILPGAVQKHHFRGHGLRNAVDDEGPLEGGDPDARGLFAAHLSQIKNKNSPKNK